MSKEISYIEHAIGPPPGPTATKRERARWMKDYWDTRRAAIPEIIHNSLVKKKIWISRTLRETTPVSNLARKRS